MLFYTSSPFIRYEVYHQKSLSLDLEKLPPTSETIRLHIKRAFFQAFLWYYSPVQSSLFLRPEDYGYYLFEEEFLLPRVTSENNLPCDLIMPCNCLKCARQNVCACRSYELPCIPFCKCQPNTTCKNPF